MKILLEKVFGKRRVCTGRCSLRRGSVRLALACALAVGAFLCFAQDPTASPGALRVRIIDQDWDAPLQGAMVQVLEADKRSTTGEDGSVLFDTLPSGSYTVVVSAQGFERKVLAHVSVLPGQAASEEVRLAGAFTDMDEFVVKDIDFGNVGSELMQLEIRSQSSGIMDNLGADLMSKAGVSTAAAAMRLVTGVNVQDGKYAVIRGLGDRYTATLLNGVRLPTSDKDKRAVQLDQYPAAMIESIQVTKTFTPDQQGDASGGGINIVTKSVPDRTVLSASVSTEYDSEATGNGDFKTVEGGGNSFGGMRGLKNNAFWDPGNMSDPRGLGSESRSATIQSDAPPANYGFKLAAGDCWKPGEDWRLGTLLTGSYSQKYKYRNGEKKVLDSTSTDYRTLDVDDATSEKVEVSTDEQLWSSGMTMGAKSENNELKFTTVYTHLSRETVDLRYRPTQYDIITPPSKKNGYKTTAAYTTHFNALSQYTESDNGSVQLGGKHVIEPLNRLELDWSGSYNVSETIEPDRQSFTGVYTRTIQTDKNGNVLSDGGSTESYGDDAYIRRWQDIREASKQFQVNAKQPFSLLDNEGYLKVGVFADRLDRSYRNRMYDLPVSGTVIPADDPYDYSHFNEVLSGLPFDYDTPMEASTEYNGRQELTAYYAMLRAPLPDWLDLIGGVRMEGTMMQTEVWSANPSYKNSGLIDVTRVQYDTSQNAWVVKPGIKIPTSEAAASIDQVDALPALALNFKKIDDVQFRLAYSQTIARPTFKELTPVQYTDVNPSLVFIGKQDLEISSLNNYDARVEWHPKGKPDLLAASVFYKTIADPIQYTTYGSTEPGKDNQYIFPENYGDAWVKGLEFEARKGLDFICTPLKDLSVGSNLTLQDSYVRYAQSLKDILAQADVDNEGRKMDGQPEYLLNVNMVYDNEASGFSAGLFYNFKGETYVSGESSNGQKYMPNIVERPFGSLDFTAGLRFAKRWKVGIEVKNLLDPLVEAVYRKPDGDLPYTSYRYGRIYGLSLGFAW